MVASTPSNLDFDWDEANAVHLARHQIQPGEAEELLRNDPKVKDYEVVDGEDR